MSENLNIYTSANSASATREANERTIKQGFKNPARAAFVNISNEAWEEVKRANVPQQYASLLDAVLETAAKNIIRRHVENHSGSIPNTIPAHWFSAQSILEEATSANTGNLTKEELTAAWQTSETRKRIMGDSRYTDNKTYRVAANAFAELILGLTARTPTYTEKQLDTMLAKLDEADLETDFGSFVLRRIEAIRNKPAKATVDLDIL